MAASIFCVFMVLLCALAIYLCHVELDRRKHELATEWQPFHRLPTHAFFLGMAACEVLPFVFGSCGVFFAWMAWRFAAA